MTPDQKEAMEEPGYGQIAEERERCARICEAMAQGLQWGHSCDEFIDEALRACAAVIREG